jgi:hypothetical protein
VVTVDMSLDGTTLVSGDKDGIVIVWDVMKNACKQASGLTTPPHPHVPSTTPK